jgi:predicted nucleic acid-binding protein
MLLSAEQLVDDIDPYDTPFMALTKHLKARLWTGEKVLLEGLQAKRYKSLITTSELLLLFDELERK